MKIVYGLKVPLDIYAEFERIECNEVTSNNFAFQVMFNGDSELENYVVFGKEFINTNKNYVQLDSNISKILNDETIVDEQYQNKMSDVLKMWVSALEKITTQNEELWNGKNQLERLQYLGTIALPESIELDWYIFEDN